MATYYNKPSRTFNEYLLVPGHTPENCSPDKVSLVTPLVRFKKGQEECPLNLNIPMVSAIMAAVSDDTMAVSLATEGGIAFIYGNQSIQDEADMVQRAKACKAGFVESDSNLSPSMTLRDVLELKDKTDHSTMPVTADGKPKGKLLGIVTGRDYRISRMNGTERVESFMTPLESLVTAPEGTSLAVANDIIWEHKLNVLPIVDGQGNLCSLVFRKDYATHKENPNEMLDNHKRYIVGAGINSRDYEDRIPALIEAGADILCLDSSEGFSDWQKNTIQWVRKHYGNEVKIGAGNVVDADGFRFLAESGADFIKIGIGGGSICITRETKGIGRGQATATIEVAAARDKFFEETGIYVPICSDGGVVHDHHITLALAMGADFVMLGRYFARFDESPSNKIMVNGQYMKEYWGEGSARAKNWDRYDLGDNDSMHFAEGVDSYVPYAGHLKDNVELTLAKIKATMCNCGALSIPEFQQKARLTVVSGTSIIEGGVHDVVLRDSNTYARTVK